jgi:hypothetical protein
MRLTITMINNEVVVNKRITVLTSKYGRVISVLIFVLIFFAIDNILGEGLKYFKYVDSPDMHSLVWNDLYKQENNTLDVMFMGSSHARFAFDTRIFDERLGIKSFNLSSSGQTPVVGYFALKEALKYQKPKLLVYEAYWKEFGTSDNTTPSSFVYNYMKGLDSKLQLLFNIRDDKKFAPFVLESLSKTYRYREYLKPAVRNIKQGKFVKKDYKNTPVKYEYFTYYENGYFGSDYVVKNEKLFKTNPFIKAGKYFKWDNKQIEYYEKTLELCKEKDIEVMVIIAPLPIPTMNFVNNYETYSNELKKITESHGVEFIDYNTGNKETRTFDNDLFYDSNHLNFKGTRKLDEMLIPVVEKYLK